MRLIGQAQVAAESQRRLALHFFRQWPPDRRKSLANLSMAQKQIAPTTTTIIPNRTEKNHGRLILVQPDLDRPLMAAVCSL